ncbi:MAG: ribosome maturation factor RimM [Actinomycetota bacterium]|nr:ribosome maturation factor RimM [Actinomycetota bacterium]
MRVVVGRVGRPHGVRGEVSVEVRTDDPHARFADGTVLDTEPAQRGPLTVSGSRWHSGRLLLSFDRVADRDEAAGLRGALLVVDATDPAPPEGSDEFHDHQLLGLRAVTVGGADVGVIADVLHLGQDVLSVRRPDGGEVLVPFVRAIVPTLDLAGGVVTLDPPPGLLEEPPSSELA